MKGSSTIKGQKLIHVDIEYDEFVEKIEISGDFFLHPEESVAEIERLVTGTRISDIGKIADNIAEFVRRKGIRMIGIDPKTIENAVKEAVK
jgi:lipoate---protein ligase